MNLMCDDQKLVDAKDRMEAIEGMKRGLESMKRNAGKPAEEFFGEFFTDEGISEGCDFLKTSYVLARDLRDVN